MSNPVTAPDSPYLEHYLGPWAMKEDVFLALCEQAGRIDLTAHLANVAARRPADAEMSYGYEVNENGTAVVDVRGTIMKVESSLSRGTSTVKMQRTFRQLANDESVKRVMVRVDSPGGSAAGISALCAEMAKLREKKPVHGFVEDSAFSGAMWVISQVSEISADPGSWVGSIGAYRVVYDYSAAAAKDGVKVHVIRSAAFKGVGTPGTEVTPEHMSEMQREINGVHEQFVEGVASGRRVSKEKIAALADGRIHTAKEGKALGLVDHVEDFDAAMARLEKKGTLTKPMMSGGRSAGSHLVTAQVEGPSAKESVMSQTETAPASPTPAVKPQAATLAEIKAACPGAPSDFLLSEIEKESSVADAQRNFIAFQAAQIRTRDEELAKVKAEAPAPVVANPEPAPAPAAVGSKPLGGAAPQARGATDGDADVVYASTRAEFMDLVRKTASGSNLDHAAAVRVAAKNHPDLYQRMLAEANPKSGK